MKRIAALILAGLMLSGCVPHTELNRLGIAEAVGVDLENGLYTVTVQYFNTDASGGVTAVDSTAPNAVITSGSGRTIESAVEALSYKTGCNIMFGSAAILVFSEDALGSLEEALWLAISHYSGNPAAYVAAARGKASDIMNVRFKEGNASVEKLKDMLRNAEELGLSRTVRVHEALEKLCCPAGGVVLPLLQAYTGGPELTEEGSSVIIAGGALCTGGRFAGRLSVREMSGLHILDPAPGSLGNCEMTISYMGRDTRVMLYGTKAFIDPEYSGRLSLGVHITADCKIVSTGISAPYSVRKELEELCAGELEKRVAELLEKTVTAYGADVSVISYVLVQHYPDLRILSGSELRNLLAGSAVSVTADVRMERYGV